MCVKNICSFSQISHLVKITAGVKSVNGHDLSEISSQVKTNTSSFHPSLLTFPRPSIWLFVGIILHPQWRLCCTSALLIGGTSGSRASLVVKGWIAAFREQVLDTDSSHVPEKYSTSESSTDILNMKTTERFYSFLIVHNKTCTFSAALNNQHLYARQVMKAHTC